MSNSLFSIIQIIFQDSDDKSHITLEEIINRLCSVTNKISKICFEKEETFEDFSVSLFHYVSFNNKIFINLFF